MNQSAAPRSRGTSFLAGATLVMLAAGCTTDDVSIDRPGAGDVRNLFPLPDDAFGDYLAFLQNPAIVVNEEGAANRYSLDLDRVGGVAELTLTKTNAAIMALQAAGVATAETKITDLSGLENFIDLEVLRITSNGVTELDTRRLARLAILEMNFNRVGTLDLRQNPALTRVRYQASSSAQDGQKLDRIDVSAASGLRHLFLPGHNLRAIDLRSNLALDDTLDLGDNPGPDGDPSTEDIVVPDRIFQQVPAANRRGVISDAEAPVQLSLGVSPATLAEGGDTAAITATLNRTSTVAVTLELALSGSATPDQDYQVGASNLSIAVGETMAETTITTIDDMDMEGVETIRVEATNVVGAQAANVVVDVTISDDDGVIQLVLNEVLYDPPNDVAGDANNDGVRDPNEDEFVEFVNVATEMLDLSGFRIFDADALEMGQPRHTIPPGTILAPKQALVVFGGGQPNGTFGGAIVQVANGFENRINLNNAGDVMTLVSPGGATVITFDIEPLSNNPDESYTRAPDITGEYVQHASVVDEVFFSPGTQADGSRF